MVEEDGPPEVDGEVVGEEVDGELLSGEDGPQRGVADLAVDGAHAQVGAAGVRDEGAEARDDVVEGQGGLYLIRVCNFREWI